MKKILILLFALTLNNSAFGAGSDSSSESPETSLYIVTYNYNAYVNNLRKLSEIDSLEMKISRIGGLQQATDEMINR